MALCALKVEHISGSEGMFSIKVISILLISLRLLNV